MKTTLSIALSLALCFAAGCDQANPYLPSVSFDRFDVQSLDWTQISTNFVFAVENPNPIEISLARFDYTLAFDNMDPLFSGDDPDGTTLEASGDSDLALPVTLEWATLYKTIQALNGSGSLTGQDTVPFALSGSFGFDTPIGIVDLPYQADGDFPALRTPGFAFDKVQLQSLGLTSADLAVQVNVSNDHASTIHFENFDYALSLEGEEVASGLLANFAGKDGVAGASTKTVDIPVTVEFISVGSAIYQLLTGGDANVNARLKATTDVDTPFGVVPLSLDQLGDTQFVH
jgi:LEA14-like dessication related protein